jgi:hypothetical protein
MKKMLLGMAALLAFAIARAQGNDGNVVTREVTVGNFTALDLNGVLNVHITQGDNVSVRVEADEKVQDKIQIETEGGTLYVKTKKGSWSNVKKMNVYITCTQLEEIRNNLVGNLTGTNTLKQPSLRYKSGAVGNTNLQLDVDALRLDIAAVGNTELSGKANDCELKNSSVGNVRAGGLLVENMDLSSSAIGNLEYNANHTVAVKSSGIGKVTNKRKKEESR